MQAYSVRLPRRQEQNSAEIVAFFTCFFFEEKKRQTIFLVFFLTARRTEAACITGAIPPQHNRGDRSWEWMFMEISQRRPKANTFGARFGVGDRWRSCASTSRPN
jgi:hypothetical protein